MLVETKINDIVNLALAEDIGSGDITADLLVDNSIVVAKIICQQPAVICGKDLVTAVFLHLDPTVTIDWYVNDGDQVSSNKELCSLRGPAKTLLTGERCALNFLQVLSSTATLTRQFVDKLAGSKTKLLDTRKTLPGLRAAQKYAVVCGGGYNHRFGLDDAILIKENHIAAYGSIAGVIAAAKSMHLGKFIEIEVRDLHELEQVLAVGVDRIMLDNFNLVNIRRAVEICAGRIKLEVSGGVSLANVVDIAATGVDYISVGMITKTVIPIEMSMLIE